MNHLDRVRKAHVAIMNHKKACVYAGVLACGKVEITDDVPTAATDGWNVVYNPKFMDEHLREDAKLRFVVLHEATHKAYQHLHVWQELHEENSMLANIAADHFVNLALQDMDDGEGFIKMPDVGIEPDPKYRGWSVKQIFTDLKRKPRRGNKGDSNDEGDQPDGPHGFDSHDWDKAKEGKGDPGREEEIRKQAEEIGRAIRQGEILRRKLAGKGSGDSQTAVTDLLAPKINWRTVLRDFVQELCQGKDEASWRKPHRRYLADDIYMPSLQGITMTELVIGLDTSGSVFGSDEMRRFVSEIASILEQVKPAKVHVVYWDTDVVGHQEFEDGNFAVQDMKIVGGGGTDGSVLFDYLREKSIKPQAIVQFTDGIVGDWGNTSVPTLWAITTPGIKAPFGVTIEVEG